MIKLPIPNGSAISHWIPSRSPFSTATKIGPIMESIVFDATYKDVKERLAQFTPEIQNSYFGQILDKQLLVLKNIEVGFALRPDGYQFPFRYAPSP